MSLCNDLFFMGFFLNNFFIDIVGEFFIFDFLSFFNFQYTYNFIFFFEKYEYSLWCKSEVKCQTLKDHYESLFNNHFLGFNNRLIYISSDVLIKQFIYINALNF